MLAGAFILLFPFIMTSWVQGINTALVYAILAIGLNILLGNAGQISLGHAAFYAVGAYISSALVLHAELPLFLSILLAGIGTAIVGFLLGTPVLRLKGHFLGIATLGLHVLIYNLVKDKLKGVVFGASAKMPEVHKISYLTKSWEYSLKNSLSSLDYQIEILGKSKPFYYDFVDTITKSIGQITEYFIIFVILVLLVYMARNILRTKVGRALAALRDSEVAARMLGVNIAIFKNIAFGLSAFYAGIAGAIYAHTTGALDETSFELTISLMILAMIIIGGIATIQGAIIGAFFFQVLNMQVIPLIFSSGKGQMLGSTIMGLCVVLAVIFVPKGIVYMLWQMKIKLTQKRS